MSTRPVVPGEGVEFSSGNATISGVDVSVEMLALARQPLAARLRGQSTL
jgi:hypothetical protein